MPGVEIIVTNKVSYAQLQEVEGGCTPVGPGYWPPRRPAVPVPVAMLGCRLLLFIARFFGATTITIDESYASTKQGTSERGFAWGDLNGWFETENYICLMIEKPAASRSPSIECSMAAVVLR